MRKNNYYINITFVCMKNVALMTMLQEKILPLFPLLTWDFFLHAYEILSSFDREYIYLENKKWFVIMKEFWKAMLYKDVDIWIKISMEIFHGVIKILMEIQRSCHEDFSLEIHLDTWRIQWRHEDFTMEIFMESLRI
jgi:hypothetical protein